jgi:hypothetical protein
LAFKPPRNTAVVLSDFLPVHGSWARPPSALSGRRHGGGPENYHRTGLGSRTVAAHGFPRTIAESVPQESNRSKRAVHSASQTQLSGGYSKQRRRHVHGTPYIDGAKIPIKPRIISKKDYVYATIAMAR